MAQTSVERLGDIANRWIEEGWQKGNVGVVDDLHAPNFVDHDPAGRLPGVEGFKEGITQLYSAFPDFYAVIEDTITDAASGKVAIRWTATGTHQGIFLNIPPTGKTITFKGIEIIRIESERIVERWGEWDTIDLLQQLGERS